MTKVTHTIYIGTMAIIVILVTLYLVYVGYDYYITPLEERFYHARHNWFKPSGAFGHGLGIIGTAMILFGVSIYIARKRYNFLSKLIRLKYLLEFHIFLCIMGPILILFHTAFKFGGIVSIAFWSMVAVVASGVIGRFIYIQIPRTIEGRELNLAEVKNMRSNLTSQLDNLLGSDTELIQMIASVSNINPNDVPKASILSKYFSDKKVVRQIRKKLKSRKIIRKQRMTILRMVKNEISLANKISRLNTMQKLFKYWHVAHLPFALIMLVIVVIHVIVTLVFGYKWIF